MNSKNIVPGGEFGRYTFEKTPEAIKQEDPLEMYMAENANKKKKRLLINPLAIIGGVIGGAVGHTNDRSKVVAPDVMKERERVSNLTFIPTKQTSYSGKVSDLFDSINTKLTPAGVEVSIQTVSGEIPLDMVTVDKFDDRAKEAFNNLDERYFKVALLNQINTDLANAENKVVMDVLKNHINFNSSVDKKASFNESDIDDIDASYALVKLSEEMNDEDIEMIVNTTDHFNDIEIPLEFKGGEVKGFGEEILTRVHPGEINSLLADLVESDRIYDLEIHFDTDGVTVTCDGYILASYLVDNMNETDFFNFGAMNKEYFKELFIEDLEVNIDKTADERLSSLSMEKVAAYSKLRMNDIFTKSHIHPLVYMEVFNDKFGMDWIDTNNDALVIAIEREFGVSEIKDIPLNKILSVKAANASPLVYTSAHAFEKVLRAFNNKPLDFFEREDDFSITELVLGLNTLNRVTPLDNIYDNFAPEVYDYISEVMAKNEDYIWGINISETTEEEVFIEIINLSILEKINEKFISQLGPDRIDRDIEDIKIRNRLIFETSLNFVANVREQMDSYKNIGPLIRSIAEKEIQDKDISNIITGQAVKNLLLDIYLNEQDSLLAKQLEELRFKEESEDIQDDIEQSTKEDKEV